MKSWAVQDAKARFSELLDDCLKEGPQVVTRRGVETAVVVPIEQWRRVAPQKQMTLKEWLLTDFARGDLNIPPRGKHRSRLRKPFE
jgi:prevent-host-death family protein